MGAASFIIIFILNLFRSLFLIHLPVFYKNIFLDLDDTLWDTKANSKVGMYQTYLHYNLEKVYSDFEAYYSLYDNKNMELWRLYHYHKITKQELIRDRFLHLIQPLGLGGEELALRMNRDFLQYTVRQTQLIDGTIPLLDYLRPKYSLYMITNGFREVQNMKMINSNILHYFDRVIVSEDAGVNKPHPDIFHYALKSTNSRKKESIMVGDNLDTDIKGAYNIGMDQIYFENNNLMEIDFEPTYRVQSLRDIFRIL